MTIKKRQTKMRLARESYKQSRRAIGLLVGFSSNVWSRYECGLSEPKDAHIRLIDAVCNPYSFLAMLKTLERDCIIEFGADRMLQLIARLEDLCSEIDDRCDVLRTQLVKELFTEERVNLKDFRL